MCVRERERERASEHDLQLLLSAVQAGLLAVWLSDQLVYGLTTGAAFHVVSSQLGAVTGIAALPSTSAPFGTIKVLLLRTLFF